MIINNIREQLLPTKTQDLYRADQAVLCTCRKYNISLGSWISGIDKDTYDIIFSIPSASLKFYRAEKFLKSLRSFWEQSGFSIVEESEVVGYYAHGVLAYSLVFKLHPVA